MFDLLQLRTNLVISGTRNSLHLFQSQGLELLLHNLVLLLESAHLPAVVFLPFFGLLCHYAVLLL
jgi:hypothetical protein